jgi:hypothetical protein
MSTFSNSFRSSVLLTCAATVAISSVQNKAMETFRNLNPEQKKFVAFAVGASALVGGAAVVFGNYFLRSGVKVNNEILSLEKMGASDSLVTGQFKKVTKHLGEKRRENQKKNLAPSSKEQDILLQTYEVFAEKIENFIEVEGNSKRPQWGSPQSQAEIESKAGTVLQCLRTIIANKKKSNMEKPRTPSIRSRCGSLGSNDKAPNFAKERHTKPEDTLVPGSGHGESRFGAQNTRGTATCQTPPPAAKDGREKTRHVENKEKEKKKTNQDMSRFTEHNEGNVKGGGRFEPNTADTSKASSSIGARTECELTRHEAKNKGKNPGEESTLNPFGKNKTAIDTNMDKTGGKGMGSIQPVPTNVTNPVATPGGAPGSVVSNAGGDAY